MPEVEGKAVLMRAGIGFTLLKTEKRKLSFPCLAKARNNLSHLPRI